MSWAGRDHRLHDGRHWRDDHSGCTDKRGLPVADRAGDLRSRLSIVINRFSSRTHRPGRCFLAEHLQ